MSLLSEVKICNLALGHIGNKTTIESLTENSVEAATCNLYYDQARLVTLEQYDWNIARKRQALALDEDVAPSGIWAYRYTYPSDCVKARKLQNPAIVSVDLFNQQTQTIQPDAIPYTIELSDDGERRTILSNLEDAVLVYTFNLEDPLLFSNMFSNALSFMLASMIVYKITGKIGLKDAMFQQANITILQAASQDGNENVPQAPRQAEWISGRW